MTEDRAISYLKDLIFGSKHIGSKKLDDNIRWALQEYRDKQLNIDGVVESTLTPKDLIAFAKWIDDKFYSHRLKIIPSDLKNYYMENRESILKRYS